MAMLSRSVLRLTGVLRAQPAFAVAKRMVTTDLSLEDEKAQFPSPPRRALLYLPGDSEKFTKKALDLDVDVVCLDLEDAVAANQKEAARVQVVESLAKFDFGRSEVAVRINPLMTDLCASDIEAILSGKNNFLFCCPVAAQSPALPQAIVVPKVETVTQLKWFFDKVDECMYERDPDFDGIIFMLAQVESALGLLNLRSICEADMDSETESMVMRLDGLIIGGDDFAADIGATRTRSAKELLFARQSVVVHAKAYGLQAIDIVNIRLKELDHLEDESNEGAIMGFTGKQIIHPDQIDPVQEAFAPSEAKIAEALAMEAAFEAHLESGTGAFTFNNMMMDMPTLIMSQNTLKDARAVGLLGPKEESAPVAEEDDGDDDESVGPEKKDN
eukprot:gene14900-33537_t